MTKRRMQRRQEGIKEAGPHDRTWWKDVKHPERQALLRDVIWERDEMSDSEDEKGKKLYVKERCPMYK